MKSLILTAIMLFGLTALFSACEKNDYQHPMHRK